MIPNLLRNAVKALARQSYLRLNRPFGRMYSYTAINLLKVSGLATLYQPLYGIRTSLVLGKTPSERGCEDRWELISPQIKDGPGSYLDLGSQLGYFGFRMTEKGHFGIGVERDRHSCSTARHLARLNGIDSTAFLCSEITPHTMAAMPRVDVVFCLSVFHHWVREHGLDHAQAIMRTVTDKCASQLFFETGQNNEATGSWHEILSFMGNDPKAWIADFLSSLGFAKVHSLGEVATHVSRTPRYLFVAKKPTD